MPLLFLFLTDHIITRPSHYRYGKRYELSAQ